MAWRARIGRRHFPPFSAPVPPIIEALGRGRAASRAAPRCSPVASASRGQLNSRHHLPHPRARAPPELTDPPVVPFRARGRTHAACRRRESGSAPAPPSFPPLPRGRQQKSPRTRSFPPPGACAVQSRGPVAGGRRVLDVPSAKSTHAAKRRGVKTSATRRQYSLLLFGQYASCAAPYVASSAWLHGSEKGTWPAGRSSEPGPTAAAGVAGGFVRVARRRGERGAVAALAGRFSGTRRTSGF